MAGVPAVMIEMRIVGVRIEMPTQQPILILSERDGNRSLPILIGTSEASAIAMHLQGMRPARPLTHDLLGHVIAALGHEVQQVRVVDFREGTFYGELLFENGTTVSARPSDAVALAVRTEVPVFVDAAILDSAGVVTEEVEEEPVEESEDEVEKFREFLDSISPEDFGGEERPDPR
jgi:bifunctional DNase/RNase